MQTETQRAGDGHTTGVEVENQMSQAQFRE
jgi:hypothetical protein